MSRKRREKGGEQGVEKTERRRVPGFLQADQTLLENPLGDELQQKLQRALNPDTDEHQLDETALNDQTTIDAGISDEVSRLLEEEAGSPMETVVDDGSLGVKVAALLEKARARQSTEEKTTAPFEATVRSPVPVRPPPKVEVMDVDVEPEESEESDLLAEPKIQGSIRPVKIESELVTKAAQEPEPKKQQVRLRPPSSRLSAELGVLVEPASDSVIARARIADDGFPVFSPVNTPEPSRRPSSVSKKRSTSNVEKSPELTDVDFSAAIGIAPGPIVLKKEEEEPKPLVEEPIEDAEIDLEPILRATEKSRNKAPAAGMDSGSLSEIATATDTIARVIPIIILAFVVVASLTIGVIMLRSGSVEQTKHLELRFVPLSSQDQISRLKPNTPLTQIWLDTTPEGLLVMHEGEVLGKTPLKAAMPLSLPQVVALELKSPYFETWITEVKRDVTGDYHVSAELIPKK